MSERLSILWSRQVFWIPAFILLVASPAVHAQSEEAKAHYQKATAHFAVGEYHDAAVEYEEAFKLKQDPAILFNAAQAFRLAGENQKALLLYNNIVKLYPGTKYAKDSKEHIEKLAQIPAAPAPATPPPPTGATTPPPATTTAPAPGPPPVSPIAPALPPGPAAPTVIAPPPPAAPPLVVTTAPPASSSADHPFYTRGWFWGTVAAVVVAAGVVTVVALSSGGGSPWNNVDTIKAGLVR